MINKFFNWVFGSFFRTAGRFLFYALLIALFSFFVSSCEVNAEDVTLKPGDFKINGNDFYTGIRLFTFNAHQDGNTPTTTELIIWYDAVANSYDMPYLIMDICSTQRFTVQRSNKGECPTYGCLINPRVYDIKKTCDADGYSGRVYRLYFDIAEWVGSRENGDEMFFLNTAAKFYPLQYETYKRYGNLINAYLSDTDDGSSWAQSQSTENAIGGVNDSVNKVDDSINNVNDSLTSTEGADLDALQNSAGWLPAGPVDSILNLPLSLLNNISGNLSGQCQPAILPLPFVDKDLTLPCLNSLYDQISGLSTWINTIGIVASAFILFTYFVHLYNWIDRTLTMRENTWADWGGV